MHTTFKNLNLKDIQFKKRNDMSTTFSQQILNGRLLLVIIFGAKK